MRMRPDRIIVGEVRGSEIIDVLQAMNTGHKGSMTTVHANSCQDLISRLETMLMIAGSNISTRTARKIILSSVEIIIFLERLKTGERVISEAVSYTHLDVYKRQVLNQSLSPMMELAFRKVSLKKQFSHIQLVKFAQ